MVTWTKPGPRVVSRFIERQSQLDFNYPDVGATSGRPPQGYEHHRVSVDLGEGEADYRRAQAALRGWRQFFVGWVEAAPSDTPLAPGATVAILAHAFGVWSMAACRIVEVVDEVGPPQRFGFAYGTLPEHPEQGEERFVVEHLTDGRVRYEVTAFFRPNKRLVRLGWPCFHRLFNRFRRQSAQAMIHFVRNSNHDEEKR